MGETTEGPARSLARKVAEIVAAVSRVPKTGHNAHFNYDFAQEADVLLAVRGEMAKRSLALFPSVAAHNVREVQGKSGGALYVTTLRVEFTLEDGDSGEQRTFAIIGEGEDNHDKGANKALTAAEKYACLKLFLIPTGADPDGDAPAEEVPRAAPKPAAVTNYPKRGPTGAAAQPRPAPQRQAPAGNLPTTFPGFGSQKGKPLAGASEKDLKWYARILRENMADPAKARFKADNAAHLAAIERMLNAGDPDPYNQQAEEGPPPPGDEDAPF
jgi:hypothetical protein